MFHDVVDQTVPLDFNATLIHTYQLFVCHKHHWHFQTIFCALLKIILGYGIATWERGHGSSCYG